MEAQSWLDLALRLLSLGEEQEAVAAYERAYTLRPIEGEPVALQADAPPPDGALGRNLARPPSDPAGWPGAPWCRTVAGPGPWT